MNYLVMVIRGSEVVGLESLDEHPSEDYLDKLTALHKADFCDVSRKPQDEN